MLWQIIKREIYDNMTSLRFGFITILLVLLMIINAITFITKSYKESVKDYKQGSAESMNKLKENCSSVYNLVKNGPGNLYKEPSLLTFCADGGEENIPNMIQERNPGWGSSWGMDNFQYSAEGFWRTYYPSSDRNIRNIMPGYLKTDWAFIIGVLVSFACILFTFDAISGEKERGTLRLVLAGAVPRSSVLLGKFIGAFICVVVPLSIAILLNLLIISVSGTAQIDQNHWSRIGMIVAISAIYATIFICLGIFVSTRFSRSSTSLLTLLLIWVVFVILTPNILGTISSGLKEVPSTDEIEQRKQTAKDDLWKGYEARGLFKVAPSREKPDMKAIDLWAECLNEERQTEERIADEYLNAQLAQIQLARQITIISPTAIYRYALENMSNTGFERHRKFIINARIYRDKFWEYIKSEDKKDPNSLHVYFVREGISEKPASFDNAPRFIENITLFGSLRHALFDISILVLFAVFFFMASYISFIKVDVR